MERRLIHTNILTKETSLCDSARQVLFRGSKTPQILKIDITIPPETKQLGVLISSTSFWESPPSECDFVKVVIFMPGRFSKPT